MGYFKNHDFEGSTMRYEDILMSRRLLIVRLPKLPRGLTFDMGEKVDLRVQSEHVILYTTPKRGYRWS